MVGGFQDLGQIAAGQGEQLVEADKGAAAPARTLVDGFGQHLFLGSALPLNQYRKVVEGKPPGVREHLLETLRNRNQVGKAAALPLNGGGVWFLPLGERQIGKQGGRIGISFLIDSGLAGQQTDAGVVGEGQFHDA